MSTYLLEIGTEELPAGHLTESESRLKQLMSEALKSANLQFEKMQTMGTPRRICLLVEGLADKQDTVTKKLKGPPLEKSFDAAGQPTDAAIGFANRNGIKVDDLDREEIGGTKYIVANLTIAGKAAAEVLAETVPKAIAQLSGERPMRWGSSDFKFSRPIRWLVSLLDDKVVPFSLDRLTAGRTTMGHRVLAPGSVEISSPQAYIGLLKEKKVLVDPKDRRDLIASQVAKLASNLHGKARQLSGPLLEEVVYITEWPHAVVGDFSRDYLDLPDALIETIMVHHQRYFPIEKAEIKEEEKSKSILSKSLLPHFITIANNDRPEAQEPIKLGNERVLKARLADGRFFYFDDQKTKLSDRKSALNQLTFQRGLGSYADKIERMLELTTLLTRSSKLEAKYCVPMERAVELCKLDLVTNLVRELPELQGYVGAWYAEQEQQPPEVVHAIASHYAPRSADDAIPADIVGQLISVVDKVDNLTGLFALGNRPSGSSDLFSLRRQAQGVIDVLVDGLPHHSVNLTELTDRDLQLVGPFFTNKKGWSAEKIKADLFEFLLQRLKGKLYEMSFGRETVDAVIAARDPFSDLHDVVIRCRCIDKLIGVHGNMDLVRSGVRVGRILGADWQGLLDEKLLHLPAEKNLWQALTAAEVVCKRWQEKAPVDENEYEQLLSGLAPLSPFVNDFFDNVMVNDEDLKLRANRHALLRQLDQYFKKVADFPKLQSLLPSV